jgi:hypothetical protein
LVTATPTSMTRVASSSDDQTALSMGVATPRTPLWCAGEHRHCGIADLRSMSMVSNDIEPQVTEPA